MNQQKTKISIRDLKAPSFILDMLKQYKKDQLVYRVNIGDRWNGLSNTEEIFIFIQDDGKPMHPSTPYHTFKRIIFVIKPAFITQRQTLLQRLFPFNYQKN